MTTIAYHDGVLAFDSASWQNGWRSTDVRKGLRLRDGSLLACTGDLTDLSGFADWYNGHRKVDQPKMGETTLIHVTAKGVVWIIENTGKFRPLSPFITTGSGGPIARTALLCGKSAIEAVRIAREVDPYTAGPVRSLKLI